ncbi:glycosyltransferase [candidate division GN15 bacterium]|nr:glycosyltransferase [candidate division GN15 bacterium]
MLAAVRAGQHATARRTHTMKKVLMISYVFPPMAAVGGYRTIKYCKFLPEFDWQPSVLTVRDGYNTAYDQSLLGKIDPAVAIYRSGNWEPLQWWDRRSQPAEPPPKKPAGTSEKPAGPPPEPGTMAKIKDYVRKAISLPDRNNFWVPFGVKTGLAAVRREQPDVLYTTSPPNSTHLVGYYLAKLTGKPLVIDFRDLWTLNEAYELKGFPPSLANIDRRLERKVIRRSSAIVTTTESFSEAMREANPKFNPDRVYTITNGIDVDDFKHVKMPETKNEKFTILHLGSLYGHRDPGFFFDAMKAWANQRPEIFGKVDALFIGNTPGYEAAAKEPPLDKLVTMLKHIPHEQVLPKLWQSDMLLLILGFDLGGRGVLPAKLFEYVCTGRPILAMVPASGEAEAALKSYGNALTVTEPDMDGTLAYLNQHFDAWLKAPEQRESSVSIPPQFDRREQAKKLSAVLNDVLAVER